jgi:hypothetical protein
MVGSAVVLQKNKNEDCAIHRYGRIAQSLHKFFEEKKNKIGGAIEGHKGHDIHSTIVLMVTRKKEMLTFGGHFQRDEQFCFSKGS